MNLSNKLGTSDRIHLDIGLLVVVEYNRSIQLAERTLTYSQSCKRCFPTPSSPANLQVIWKYLSNAMTIPG